MQASACNAIRILYSLIALGVKDRRCKGPSVPLLHIYIYIYICVCRKAATLILSCFVGERFPSTATRIPVSYIYNSRSHPFRCDGICVHTLVSIFDVTFLTLFKNYSLSYPYWWIPKRRKTRFTKCKLFFGFYLGRGQFGTWNVERTIRVLYPT